MEAGTGDGVPAKPRSSRGGGRRRGAEGGGGDVGRRTGNATVAAGGGTVAATPLFCRRGRVSGAFPAKRRADRGRGGGCEAEGEDGAAGRRSGEEGEAAGGGWREGKRRATAGTYNLLSISQLCKLGYNYLFTDEDVTVFRRDDSSVAFKGKLKGDLYLVDFDVDRVNPEACLIAKSSMGWIWHRRLDHVGMRNLATLLKGEHILGLTNVTFEKDRGIKHEFSAPYDPPQNGIVERKNRTLIETARAMLDEYKTSDIFWAEAARKFRAEDSQGVPTALVDGIDAEGTIEHPDQAQVPPVHHPRIHHTVQRDHPVDNILGDIRRGVEDALGDPDWVIAMQEELNNFTRNQVWTLVERPDQNVIGTKWIFRNNQNEHGVVVRNKARLFQMDVKSAFLNRPISELVFVEQPPGFEDPKLPNHAYKLQKALYGLKQAPRAWFECLRDFLLKNGFEIGKADTTLFTKKFKSDLFICQIYVDDIIFGSTNASFCEEFSSIMTKRFEMSMMGELTFFLGLQVKQAQEGTFISQTKYVKDILKKFGMEDAKLIKTPMPTNGHLDLDDNGKCVDQKGCDFELLGYSDSDYVGCKVDRKSSTGTSQFLGRSLVSWSSKKQNSIA
uniref:Retrotransposon protein, putative, Ty1-copia subclass n=1 Tax=Oryza sativa subsp. japonica TaxID=39947 RepID=Q2QRH1_ORYSJ|nr:retrotransposon protein, putative, Ty1-copia subclass [Oryza sativa Japonica Group]